MKKQEKMKQIFFQEWQIMGLFCGNRFYDFERLIRWGQNDAI